MKLGVLNVVKIFCICVVLLLMGDSHSERQIKIGNVTNEIKLGPFAGQRNMAVGVKNILEEYLQEMEGHHVKIHQELFQDPSQHPLEYEYYFLL